MKHQLPAVPIRITCTVFLFACLVARGQSSGVAWDGATGNLPIQRIGANDLVAVSVYGAPEFTRTVRVRPDGFIRIAMVKRSIRADSLMPAELEEAIADALKAEDLLVDPLVTVTVSEYVSRPISVMGCVRKPLTFQSSGQATLLDALARAEGISPEAGSEILVSQPQTGADGRTEVVVHRIQVHSLIDAADQSVNLKLFGGEEVRVPAAGRVYVVGNVKKPGVLVIQEDGPLTLLKALAQSEGLMPFTSKQAFIYRTGALGAKSEIPVDLHSIMQRKSTDFLLMANDIL